MIQVDLFPPTSLWVPPTSLPRIPDGALVAIDTETRDEGLAQQRGPGWATGEGWLCGVSYAWSGGADYIPIRHPDTTGCFPEAVVLDWLRDIERRCQLVFQHAGYDAGWTGLVPTHRWDDTHTMAVLLDENRHRYDLDSIAAWMGIPGKDEQLLREAVVAFGGNGRKPKEWIWRLPARYAAPYAAADAVSTLGCAERMLPMIRGQDLTEAYELETELSPCIIDMRRRGIRINIDQAERSQAHLLGLRDQYLASLGQWTGQRRTTTIEDVRSPRWLEALFRELSVSYPRTAPTQGAPDGNASFEKEWLEACPHPAGQAIAMARSLHDGAEKFIGTFILGHTHMGRIHAEIHQLRDTDGGTRTYRMSYANPPLQQMNRADPDRATPGHKDYVEGFVDIGTIVRECFEPEPGEVWAAPDYSQQEYRLIVHFSAELGLPAADEAVRYYSENADADYHNFVRDMTGLTRKRAKDCNFAKAFGAGIPKFALMAKLGLDDAQEIMGTYDEKLPFVSRFGQVAKDTADRRGYVRLIDRRRRRFEQWEASWIPAEEFRQGIRDGHKMTPCSREEAATRQQTPGHPWRGKRLRRADTRKAGNSVIQGSGAVQTKKAMLAQYREGYTPILQMHDELCHSVGDETKARRIGEIMVDVVRLRVPVRVDAEFGTNWANAKYSFEEACRMRDSVGRK